MVASNSSKKIALYSVLFILLAGSLLGSGILSRGFLSQASSAAGGQQGSQNQAAQSSISIESANLVAGTFPRVTLIIRNVGSVPVILGLVTLQGTPSNSGFRGSLADPDPSCTPSSTLDIGGTCAYTTAASQLASMSGGDIIYAKATTSVGTFAQTQFMVPGRTFSKAGVGVSPSSQGTQSITPSGQIEFFANLTLRVSSPGATLSRAEGIAYENGGYVAYSTMTNTSAYVIVRVPTSAYQQALASVRSMGNVSSYSTTSNDVTVKIADLNATLQSYLTERNALLGLVNKSTLLNNTLQIYSQLQTINAQIDLVQSQITNTKRLVDYSTITISMFTQAAKQPFSLKLTTTPRTGTGHLDVTFMPTIGGGTTPYYVNYDFGDGSSSNSQQPVTHYFAQPGDYNVTLSATDSAGDTVVRSAVVHVGGSVANLAFANFVGYVSGLLIGVVEGIAEVAAVTIPLILVFALVVVPLGKKFLLARNQSKQTQS